MLTISMIYVCGKMYPLKQILILLHLFFQQSYACKKVNPYNDPKSPCNVYSYYYGNCSYDRFGIREQLRLPGGKNICFAQSN